MEIFRIEIPDEFSFKHSLALLSRSPKEVLHYVDAVSVSKALVPRANGMGGKPVILQVEERDQQLEVKVMNGPVNAEDKKWISIYIREWFDLDTDRGPFYQMARQDELLAPLVKAYRGYRIVGQPDLFESLVWAVLGQQINLAFAYTLKSRFVKAFGQQVDWQDRPHYIFPLPAAVAEIRPEQLLALQFSRQKAAYTVNIAHAFLTGDLSKEKLLGLSLDEAKTALCKIKGVGNWTANYAIMKTFRYPDAFPLEDAGLHNAIKQQLNLKSKPSLDRVKKIFKKYKGWEAYATLYLWKSLK